MDGAPQVVTGDKPDGETERFIAALVPLLKEHHAHEAYLFGSRARGTAQAQSDIDVIIVAPTERAVVERFRDYLPAILSAHVGVDMFVYTKEEFAQMKDEERPFLIHALEGFSRRCIELSTARNRKRDPKFQGPLQRVASAEVDRPTHQRDRTFTVAGGATGRCYREQCRKCFRSSNSLDCSDRRCWRIGRLTLAS